MYQCLDTPYSGKGMSRRATQSVPTLFQILIWNIIIRGLVIDSFCGVQNFKIVSKYLDGEARQHGGRVNDSRTEGPPFDSCH